MTPWVARRVRRGLVYACVIGAWGGWPSLRAAADEAPFAKTAWLRVGGEYRIRFEGFDGARFQAGNDDFYTLSRLRLGVTLQLMEPWRFVLQLQDSRVFLKNQRPSRPPFQDALDAHLAYVELGGRPNARLSARIGRQELAFGEQRLIGSADWLNTGRTFDAVRATLAGKQIAVDGFAGYVVKARVAGPDRPDPGNVLYGVYAVVPRLVPRSTLEPYFLGRRASNQPTEVGLPGILHSGTVGVRWITSSLGDFDTAGEVAGQFGSVGADVVRAWAGHWLLGYTLPGARYQPRFIGEYNYASGDRDRRDGRHETFDQLFPTAHDKYGLSDQVGWKNVHHARGGVELHATAKWLATVRYHSWWLASAQDALYDASGAVLVKAGDAASGRHVGQELDVQAMFSGPKKVKVGAGYAHLFPGLFLRRTTDGQSYSYPYVSLNVGF